MRVRCFTTFTSGFMFVSVFSALSTFGIPTRSVAWRIWRWRFDASTTSSSIMPMVPTPAEARYMLDGEPRPPAPMQSTLLFSSFTWPATPTSGSIVWRE